jgi:hypothetical protein
VFYEVKTYPNVLYGIRMAIGQLMEYAYFPDKDHTDEFCIVTHLPISPEESRYMSHLSEKLKLKINYLEIDIKDK